MANNTYKDQTQRENRSSEYLQYLQTLFLSQFNSLESLMLLVLYLCNTPSLTTGIPTDVNTLISLPE